MLSSKWAKVLLDNNCVKLNPNTPFTYASGLKGPIYCDNRLLPGLVKVREELAIDFKNLIKEKNFSYELIAGLATAGIPHGALLADRLEAPFVYIRSQAKGHGKGQQVEGLFKQGDRAILIEDLVNQGSSLEKAIEGGRRDGLIIEHCLAIVDYQTAQSKERLSRLGVTLHSLTNFSAIIRSARESQSLSEKQVKILELWHSDPKSWSERFA